MSPFKPPGYSARSTRPLQSQNPTMPLSSSPSPSPSHYVANLAMEPPQLCANYGGLPTSPAVHSQNSAAFPANPNALLSNSAPFSVSSSGFPENSPFQGNPTAFSANSAPFPVSSAGFPAPLPANSPFPAASTPVPAKPPAQTKNWTAEESIYLIEAYKQAKAGEVDGERVDVLNGRVHQAFKALSNTTNRTCKACTDKLASMRDTFKFISDFEAGRIPGSTGRPPWYDLEKKERATYLAKYKKVALTPEVHNALKSVLETRPTCNPHVLMDRNAQENGFQSAADENVSDITDVAPQQDNFTTGQAKKKGKKRPREEDVGGLEILRSIAGDHKEMVKTLKESQQETNQYLRAIADSLKHFQA